MSKEQELRDIIDTAHAKLSRIRARARRKKNRGLVGKFFKYANSYGQDESWLMYIKVTGLDKQGDLVAWVFQQDSLGKVTVDMDDIFSPFNGWEEISADEFRAAWLVLLARLQEYGEKNG